MWTYRCKLRRVVDGDTQKQHMKNRKKLVEAGVVKGAIE